MDVDVNGGDVEMAHDGNYVVSMITEDAPGSGYGPVPGGRHCGRNADDGVNGLGSGCHYLLGTGQNPEQPARPSATEASPDIITVNIEHLPWTGWHRDLT